MQGLILLITIFRKLINTLLLTINTTSQMQNLSDQLLTFQEHQLETNTQTNTSLSLSDSLARIFQLLESAEDSLKVQEAVSYLKQAALLLKVKHKLSLLKMSKDCPLLMKEEVSTKSLNFLPTLIQIVHNTQLKCSFLILLGYSPKIERGIILSDILEQNVSKEYFLSQKTILGKNQAQTLDTQSNQGVIVAQRGRNPENSSDRTPGAPTVQRLEVNKKGQSNTLTGVQKDNLVLVKCISHYGHKDKDAVESDIVPTLKAESHGHEPMIVNTNMAGQQFENDYAGTLRAGASDNYMTVSNIRRMTEIECERLQGFPDNWTKFGIYEKQVWINKKEKTFRIVEGVESVSKTQRYKMCGNAVTVSIVELIGKKLLSGI